VENQKENEERENTHDVSPKQIQSLKQQMIVSAVAVISFDNDDFLIYQNRIQ